MDASQRCGLPSRLIQPAQPTADAALPAAGCNLSAVMLPLYLGLGPSRFEGAAPHCTALQDTDDHAERLEGFYSGQAHACEVNAVAHCHCGRAWLPFCLCAEGGSSAEPNMHASHDLPLRCLQLQSHPCLQGWCSVPPQMTPSAPSSCGAGGPCWPPALHGCATRRTW